MKKVWNVPEVQELTIQATSCNDWGWNSGRPNCPGTPNRPSNPCRPGHRPGWGDDMCPGESQPEDGTSSF